MVGTASIVSGSAAFRILNCYDHVADWLLAGCDPQRVTLRLGVVANEIRWSRDDVEIIAHSRAGHSPPFSSPSAQSSLFRSACCKRRQTRRARFASIRG
jgi:hypothetical protein